MFTNRIQLDDEQTALRQVEKLGYGALDVRHIVVTRLDFDQRRHRRLPARDGARARQRVDGGQYRAPGLLRPQPVLARSNGISTSSGGAITPMAGA